MQWLNNGDDRYMNYQQKQEIARLALGSPPSEAMPEEVERYQRGNKDALGAIWAYFYPITLKKAFQYFPKDEEAARSAAFEAMEHFTQVLGSYTEEGKLNAFHGTVVNNQFHNYYAKQKRAPTILYGMWEDEMEEGSTADLAVRKDFMSEYEDLYDYPHGGVDPSLEETAIKIGNVVETRAALYPADQEVFDLIVEGYDYEEISEFTGKSHSAVAQSVYRIRGILSE